MAWVYLDDQFPQHPKVALAGGDAAWLFVAGLCYCRQYGTEGRIPKAQVPRLSDRRSPNRLASKLAEVGLWEDDDDHWRVHDWSDWNRAAESRSERGRKAAKARWDKERDASSNAQASPEHEPSNADPPAPGCTIPSPSLDAEHPPPDSSNAPDESGGVMVEAAWLMAWDETNRRGSDIGNPEGYARSRFKPLLKDNQDRWAQVIAANPEVTAQELVDGLAPPAEPHPTEGTAAAQLRKMAENAQRMADEPEPDPDGLSVARAALERRTA